MPSFKWNWSDTMFTTYRLTVIVCAIACSVAASPAHATLFLTPASTPLYSPSSHTNPMNAAQVEAAIEAIIGPIVPTLTEVYKQNAGGSEEKSFASSYTTTFSNTGADPHDALIEYDSGPVIQFPTMYLVLKDGNNSPFSYIFDLNNVDVGQSWDGVEDIVMTGFFPNGGAISHISIFVAGNPVPAPEPASLAIWGLGLGLAGVIGRRRMRRA